MNHNENKTMLKIQEQMGERAGGCYIDLIKKIRRRRRELGVSQTLLGNLCGIHQNHVSKIERFHIVPRTDILIKMITFLHLELSLDIEDGWDFSSGTKN